VQRDCAPSSSRALGRARILLPGPLHLHCACPRVVSRPASEPTQCALSRSLASALRCFPRCEINRLSTADSQQLLLTAQRAAVSESAGEVDKTRPPRRRVKGGEGQSDGSEYGGVGGGTQGASCGHACARRECGELGHGQAGHAADAGCLAAHVAGGAPGSCAQAPRTDGNDGLLQVAMRRVARNSRLLFPCVDRPATLILFDDILHS
jgi:hypothetical protein